MFLKSLERDRDRKIERGKSAFWLEWGRNGKYNFTLMTTLIAPQGVFVGKVSEVPSDLAGEMV
jgi:hypothetical protein